MQAAINAGANLLPNDLPMPPLYSKVNPADAPVLTLAVTSPSLPVIKVHDLVENRLAPKLSQVPGVGLVSVAGGQRPAVRIQANPAALAALGMSLEDLRTAIGNANVNQAKGSFDGAARASTLDANDQLRTAADYANQIVAFKNGSPVRLKDVAAIVDAPENDRLSAWAGYGGQQRAGVILNIQRQPGANVIETVDRLKLLLPKLQGTLAASLAPQLVLLGSLWSAWSLMGRASADPLVARQQLAIAQSLLREIELQPLTGTTTAGTPGRTGYASVAAYNGLVMNGITDAEGTETRLTATVPGGSSETLDVFEDPADVYRIKLRAHTKRTVAVCFASSKSYLMLPPRA